MVGVFRNRLMNQKNVETFDDIWQQNCRQIFSNSNQTQYFVPTGAKMSDLQLINEDEWQQIIQRNITTCG